MFQTFCPKLQPLFRGGHHGNLRETGNLLDGKEVPGTLFATKRGASFSLVGENVEAGFPGVGPRTAQT